VVVEKIVDAQGKIIFEAAAPEPLNEDNRAISARNAFVMSQMLNEVTRTGTAARAQAALRRPDLYGKTGTTDNAVDAWFAGYHPTLSTVVWMGYDKPQSLGDRESGSRAALPIWIDYMGAALKDVPVAPVPVTPAGLTRNGSDWLYSEWQSGGWVARISDTLGAQYATPPDLLSPLTVDRGAIPAGLLN
jgi:penicillin-binding protein 1A